MKINTYQFGEIEFEPEMIINFENGILGFEQLKKFIFVKPEDDFFYWINSVDQPNLAFPLMGTRVVDENYPSEDEFESFGIVTLNKDPLKITINLKAPVFINQNAKTGYQKIIDQDEYSVNYNLFVE